MASHRQAFWPTDYFAKDYTPMGLWKHILHPIQFTLTVNDFGVNYDYSRTTWTILSAHSMHTTNLKKIGNAHSTVASHQHETTSRGVSTSPCQGMLTDSSPSLTTHLYANHNIAHVKLHHAPRKTHWSTMTHPGHHPSVSSESNKSLASSCTMCGPLTLSLL